MGFVLSLPSPKRKTSLIGPYKSKQKAKDSSFTWSEGNRSNIFCSQFCVTGSLHTLWQWFFLTPAHPPLCSTGQRSASCCCSSSDRNIFSCSSRQKRSCHDNRARQARLQTQRHHRSLSHPVNPPWYTSQPELCKIQTTFFCFFFFSCRCFSRGSGSFDSSSSNRWRSKRWARTLPGWSPGAEEKSRLSW